MFLKPSMPVLPTLAQDYPEWHKGRTDFSLWYLEIRQPELLNYLEQLREYFSDLLFTPNTRQFHITLFICGFLTNHNPKWDDDFSHQQLQQQLKTLKPEQKSSFRLKTGAVNSFESALFIEIDDLDGNLAEIRQQLYRCSDEIAPLEYCPHITLGLYKHEFCSNIIFERMQNIPQQSFEFQVRHLTFGTYHAQMLQGPLTPYHQFLLGDV
ncbi:2'-5' RNA ligase family protein [Acinetobacter bouvetii]|nr:2'-5' RNA ligase family protein [Acinetobacter bouvetii]